MHHEHHYRALERARDHLTAAIQYLRSASERMTGDPQLDAVLALGEVERIAVPVGRLRDAASARFDEHARHKDFPLMKSGVIPFPDERPRAPEPELSRTCELCDGTETVMHDDEVVACPRCSPGPPLNAPNAKRGAELVAEHGGVQEALKALHPLSREFDDVQAYRYATGDRPPGWVPPVVRRDDP